VHEDRDRATTAAVVVAATMTLAWAAFVVTHLESLVFRGEGEYEQSALVRGLGTWGVLPAALAWWWLLRLVRSWPATASLGGWVRPLAWATVLVLPLVTLVNALPFIGAFG